ncbi:MAG TPA: NAD-dependent epimerase/dehydratase family protein [Candidatus Kapabacteria bacterium]|nr:NAD-dependent epimerase/dehydratase family protein [Candidatus Kapabacteria bacterium]
MKILVTGGAGFIGSHISDTLIGNGHTVVVLDDLSSGNRSNVSPKAEFVQGSIANREFINELFDKYQFDIVDHHAAQVDVRKSVADPAADAQTNIIGSINLLEASRRSGVKHFIFASTGGAIYGEQDHFPADESHPTRPESPYGAAKRSVETYLEYYRKIYGLNYTIFRYSNVYGPRQDPHGEAGVVAIFCSALIESRQAFIFGDGKQTRDYVYVGDLVSAHLKALENINRSGTYNISTGIETDVNTIFTILSNYLSNGKSIAKYADARLGEQFRSVCDPKKVARELGWKPRTTLEEGLRLTADYFKQVLG